MKTFILSLAAGLALTPAAWAASAKPRDPSKLPPPANQKDVTYAKDIKPILDKTCLECHGATKPKGKLRLDSLENILKGGEEGKILEPGNSAKSVLAYAVARTQARAMPPKDKGPPLTTEQAGLIRAWIDQGAK